MREFKSQFGNALLVVLTVAAVIAACLNFQQNYQENKRFRLPDDGVTWVDRAGKDVNEVIALSLAADSPAGRGGIRPGDQLVAIETVQVHKATDVPAILARLQQWRKASYTVHRNGVEIQPWIIIGERAPDYSFSYQYLVGIAYLFIGLFVHFRRGNAYRSIHFLVLCIVSFILSTFHYTGKLNDFDQFIYWGNFAAGLFAPTIFLHFCLSFPRPYAWLRHRGISTLLYVPAILFLVVAILLAKGILRVPLSLVEVRWLLDRLQLGMLSTLYLCGAGVLSLQYRREQDPVTRQQIKWLRNGAIAGIVPFTAFYVFPYFVGFTPSWWMKASVLTLGLIPVTWAYAILRYRLMDVDVIFQQGYAYTLATLAVLGGFYGVFFGLGRFEDLSPTAAVILILVAAFVFQPIRNWMQEVLDRNVFYRDRYDYRKTLVEFARELSSETDLEKMLTSMADRLVRTLNLQRIGVFLADPAHEGQFKLHMTHGKSEPQVYPAALDLSFLPAHLDKDYIFFERTHHNLDVVSREMPVSVRNAIAELDLTYYLPCVVRGKTNAYLGVSRPEEGDFLSSDDLELLQTLTGSVGIAIENARLYHSLQQKVGEYERLKEFSENIVESINVGILAADLEDQVESWNSQIEQLTGIPRQYALGRRLSELFPPELALKFDEVSGESGIHNIYKFSYRPLGLDNPSSTVTENEIILNIAIAPLVSKDMTQIGRLIIFDDITERSELEARLVQADKLSSIGMLAAGVAHEVNTPLAVISTYAQMLAKQVSGDDQKTKLLEKIAKQTFRASEIVNSLLNFSRTSKAEQEDVNLNRVISETVSLISHQVQKMGVSTECLLAEQLPPISGHSNKLQQVFLNLLLNARDAMENGGVLTVRSWSDSRSVHVEVADTGQGILPENLARIYDPFFTTKMARKGTGLGLSITYGIVQEHGGTIDVQSTVGVGTTFHLEFPLRRTVAPALTESAAASAQLNA